MPVNGVGIYVLLTHLPVERTILLAQNVTFPLDLHALSTPPAFILSQDQTLKKNRIGATLKIQLLNFQGSFPSAKIRKRLPDSSISFFFSLISLTNALFLLFHLLFSHIFVSSIFILPFQKPLSRVYGFFKISLCLPALLKI